MYLSFDLLVEGSIRFGGQAEERSRSSVGRHALTRSAAPTLQPHCAAERGKGGREGEGGRREGGREKEEELVARARAEAANPGRQRHS